MWLCTSFLPNVYMTIPGLLISYLDKKALDQLCLDIRNHVRFSWYLGHYHWAMRNKRLTLLSGWEINHLKRNILSNILSHFYFIFLIAGSYILKYLAWCLKEEKKCWERVTLISVMYLDAVLLVCSEYSCCPQSGQQ